MTKEEVLYKLAAYCSSAERCVQDVEKKLQKADLSQEDNQQILHRLQQEKFVDDRRYAFAFVNDKIRFNQWGRIKIAYELKKKAISSAYIDEALASDKITLDKYEAQKADIQKLISDYQVKLDDKTGKLQVKEQEFEQLTKDAAKARSVIQPFRNHKIDFVPPQITEKVPLFGTDKWVERQNKSIAKQFTEIVRKIESLYRSDAARQVEAAQRNILADYGELYQLRKDVKTLIENNDELKSTLETMLDQFANPSLRLKIFAIADALAGGTPVAISSGGGGGGNYDSDLRWDGRRPDEKEEAYRRRCLMFAIGIVAKHNRMYNKRK